MMSICTLVVSTFSSNSGGNLVLFKSFMSAADSCMIAKKAPQAGRVAKGSRRGEEVGGLAGRSSWR